METTQEISLCSYLCLKLAKMPCFSYYLLCFFCYKIREQKGGTGSAQRWGLGGGWHQWEREEAEKGIGE
jgi:hypothetical protein